MPRPAAIDRHMTPAQWALLFGLSLLWGGSFFFNEVAVRELPPFSVVVGRVLLAALILLAVLRLRGVRLPGEARLWGAFLIMGLLNNALPFSLIVWGQTSLASGVAAILNATTPLFTVLVAHLFTADEKATPGRLLGVAVGLGGVAVLVGGASGAGGEGAALAALAVLGGALSYACAGVFGRRFRTLGISPLVTATGQVVASSALLLPVMLVVDRPWTLALPGPATWGALVGLASLSTALAYLLYFRLLATAGATNLLLVTLLIPVSALLLGVGVLGEVVLGRHLAGMALIGGGLIILDGRLPGRLLGRLSRPGAAR
ncbi:DMT family transporter [Roseospirillum parvum]|uniref:Threonine/homoserine efflux transporter RhtA n=1 Tax=Roseospirillum parvum TaxID=83401 RepID=A0A1G7ZKF5_9PROT|nr:DMT family transporter [Roseospirillum parvum]SDH09193.1 Threonine/homoserine efflux transporter RhtA [Roseospirillum parvum]